MSSSPTAVPPGGTPTMSMLGQPLAVRLSSEQTGGAYAVTEAEVGPGWAGPPMHIHHLEDEAVYVIDGALRFVIGGNELPAPAGTLVHIPRGTPHTFRSDSDQISRQLTVYTPGGFERIFAAVAAAGPGVLEDSGARYGLELLRADT